MKIPIGTSILIVVIAAGIVWNDGRRLASSRERNARLVTRAGALGISTDPDIRADAPPITKRDRENHGSQGRQSVEEFFAMVKEADDIEAGGGEVDDAMAMKIMRRLTSFNVEEMEILIRETIGRQGLDAKYRQAFIAIPLMRLAKEAPQAALGLLPELSGMTDDKEDERRLYEEILSTSLASWGKTDPKAAVAWVRENGGKYSGYISETTKSGILAGAVGKDPRLAFRLIGELEIKDGREAVASIARATRSTGERIATLSALRAHLATFPDDSSRVEASAAAVRQLAFSSYKDGFEATREWLDSANLTPSEHEAFITTMAYPNVRNDTVKWIGWLGKNLPEKKANPRIAMLVHDWTLEDYQAAGQWLASAPEGSARDVSAQAYAVVVSKYEPEAAARWAMTLPAGKDRDLTLREIHRNWPEGDAAAKAAFAKEHGIR